MVSSSILTTSNDPFTRGLDYLYGMRSLALEPDMVDLVHDPIQRIPVCTWVGNTIDAINAQLQACLQVCHDCFHPWEQPTVQIFAVPLAQSFGLEAFCNFQTATTTILVDAGRVMPQDWLRVVMHEYAHAHAGVPGHHPQFARSLTHLCLGLDIPPPTEQPNMDQHLRSYPPCHPTADPLAFWRGEVPDWQLLVASSYFLL